MRLPLALLALALGAGLAAAQDDNPNVAYQNALLARPLTPAVKAFCDARAPAGSSAYDACKVTRLALADFAAGQDKGFPPMADPHYTTKAEFGQLMDLMTKHGG